MDSSCLWVAVLVAVVEIKGQSWYSNDTSTVEVKGQSSFSNNSDSKARLEFVRENDLRFCSRISYDNLRYRHIDGRCNHPKNYGTTGRSVKRYLPAHYQDKLGENRPRIYSVTGDLLPSPRMVSWKLHPDQTGHDNNTMLVMQAELKAARRTKLEIEKMTLIPIEWRQFVSALCASGHGAQLHIAMLQLNMFMGQFIDHDVSHAPVLTDTNVSIKCCGVLPEERLPDCFPIEIPPDDPVFSDCMEFFRSLPAMDQNGHFVYPREQLNSLTSFIDGSGVYGSDLKTYNRIRSDNGRGVFLNTRLVDGQERLPLHPDLGPTSCVSSNTSQSYCQLAGDSRVNEQPGLGSIHLLFHLHHNRIVRLLVNAIIKKRGQPSSHKRIIKFIRESSDTLKEKLFQEAKKILGAIIQKITYCDWLPMILGPHLIDKFQLGCVKRSWYNPDVDPRVANSFLAAALRFGHTLIPNAYNIGNNKIHLKDSFNIPDASIRYYDNIIKCLVQEGSEEAYDRFISSSVSEHLFESTRGHRDALDLIAVNIQRGRDHGIPAYYYWRQHYRLRRVHNLDEFGEAGRAMKTTYRDIRDVDLFPGGLLEPSLPGGVVGETFGHILANQFADLKFGDVHFFLHQQAPQGFLAAQVKALLQVTLSSIICANSAVSHVQSDPFYMASEDHPARPCSDYPEMDVQPWMVYFSD